MQYDLDWIRDTFGNTPKSGKPPTVKEYREWKKRGSKGSLGYNSEEEMQFLESHSTEELLAITIALIRDVLEDIIALQLSAMSQAWGNPEDAFNESWGNPDNDNEWF